ncbi:MAG: hypothetical protein E7304_09690 [Butyrivibrio sp.]|jgi:hypothetical protein|uniref:hypothetical protein n=1 Tax=Butyrivibrio sp. TaxID=28121 RepID=UPI001EB90F68|nr:hypothetical protein [Butyrivibrio sp.]MBE5841667.1 hypothetical protein [Butyrivibrio sp.]
MNEKQRLDWHSGFEGGLRLCLRKYASDLEIEREHPLSSEPLRIDYLILKKKSGVKINNDIGYGFRVHNIIEYKNPNDMLNVDVLYKIVGYACLYKALGEKVNLIKAQEITVSIFRATKPKKLFKAMASKGIKIVKTRAGVYELNGVIVDIPVRVIVISELQDHELKAISIMKYNADEDSVKEFLIEARKYTDPCDKRYADAVLQVSATVNTELYERIKGEPTMCEALRKLMADELKDAELKGTENGKEIGKEETFDVVNELNDKLIKSGRIKDLEKSTNDKEFQKQLIRELVDPEYNG